MRTYAKIVALWLLVCGIALVLTDSPPTGGYAKVFAFLLCLGFSGIIAAVLDLKKE